MKLFNRNNELKEKMDIVEEKIDKLEENIKELNADVSSVEESINVNNSKIEIEKNIIELLDSRLKDLQDECDKKFGELIEENLKLKEELALIKSQIEEQPKPNQKGHLYPVGEVYAKEYSGIYLSDGKICSKKGRFSFDIDDVIDIKENLQKYYDEGLNIASIGKKYSVKSNSIYRLIWNIEEGNFDKLIEKYNENIDVPETKEHIRYVSPSLRRPIEKNMSVDEEGNVFLNGRKLKYSIDDVILLKKNIPNVETYPNTISLIKNLKIGEFAGNMLIWRIEEGYFDELIDEYLNMGADKVVKENYHIFKLKKSYTVPFNNLKLGNGGELYTKNNVCLPYNIQDVIELKKVIYSGRYTNVKQITELFKESISNSVCLKLIWNIEEGNFDELIDEYSSRKYTYENKDNILYVNEENTGLTIDKCNLIIDCIINDPNKQESINRLIKNYPTTHPKFIRIIANEYNNINLNKVLKKEVPKIEKIDNPQKRREQGIYL